MHVPSLRPPLSPSPTPNPTHPSGPCPQVEWAHQVIGSDEKLYIAGAAVLGGVAAFSLLVVVPPGALAFNIPAASEEFTVRVAAVVRQRIKSLPAGALQPVAEAGPLGSGLALLAGALGECVMGG